MMSPIIKRVRVWTRSPTKQFG